MTKSLFLFAGYDKDGIIDCSLVHHIQSLSKIGDVIVVMDCDCTNSEIQKISKYCIYVNATRHGEYDFGSYKRGYIYARDNNILQNYNYVYMVNDSVYGPLFNIKPIIKKLESFNTDAFGIIESRHKIYAPIESWFIGMNKKVFLSNVFDKFMTNIKQQKTKIDVTIEYENGFTDLLNANKFSYKCLFSKHGRSVYNQPKNLFIHGCPFIKKASFTRHFGSNGMQINYVLNNIPEKLKKCILTNAKRVYGDKIENILTNNPLKILIRKIQYGLHKLKVGGI